jgi:hypothetical protein
MKNRNIEIVIKTFVVNYFDGYEDKTTQIFACDKQQIRDRLSKKYGRDLTIYSIK